jgi:hypothetical protein
LSKPSLPGRLVGAFRNAYLLACACDGEMARKIYNSLDMDGWYLEGCAVL